MAYNESQEYSAGTVSAEVGERTVGTEHAAKLQALLAEVTALANQLRRTGASVPGQAHPQAGGLGVLQVLDGQGALTVPAIARYRAVSRQCVQTLVNRLEDHGYVALSANPAHKSSGLVQLTDHGRRLLADVMVGESKSSETLVPHVAETRLVSAARLLHQIRELLTGKGLPPAGTAGKHPPRKRATARPIPTDRSQAGPEHADLPLSHEPAASEESEFPLNLL